MTFEDRQRSAALDATRSSYAAEKRAEQQRQAIDLMDRQRRYRPPQADECRCPACLGIAPQGWARVRHVSKEQGEHPMNPPFG